MSVEDVRRVALRLPRTTEHLIRDRVKFRVGRIVYVAFSRDETQMGVAFDKAERAGAIAAEPDTFVLPSPSDLRYRWIEVRMDAIDLSEMRELVVDAWLMVVPRRVAQEWSDATGGHLSR